MIKSTKKKKNLKNVNYPRYKVTQYEYNVLGNKVPAIR